MNIVIIFYLLILSAFSLGNIYSGINSLKIETNDRKRRKISLALKAQDGDDIDYLKFGKNQAVLSLTLSVLYMSLIGLTFTFVPNMIGTLTVREIHFIRTCIIAIIVLHLFRDLWLSTMREKFIIRKTATNMEKLNYKTFLVFTVLSIALIYSIYTQINYPW